MHKFVSFRTFVFLVIISLVLIFLNSLGILDKPRSVFISVISPLQSKVQLSSNLLDDFLFTISEIKDFKNKTEDLQLENQRLNVEIVRLKELERENQILRKELKFKESLCGSTDCITFIPGNVVSRGLDDYGKYVTIDIGLKEGVENGQAVTTEGGIMIGKVLEVFDSYSKVVLVVSPDSSINSIAQTTRANGLAKGKYGTSLRLEMIDQSEELIEGDLIITSGLELEIPKGLLLGKIINIEQSPNAVFKSADIELLFDSAHLEEVFLVKKNEQ